ncbi:hypothetical protein KGF54_004797 [Candida jiufengensis]|uniref:uncharacterized protein n=1 Tax=Candida jiufengensis TaxID=497108 RepID=UPI002224E90D|nr:uncharacterized protein KGF54_004797 [Candida jiufengensis]KAI5951722.1 hypothetical protein KGF54_004797 [Candida jiufengensis]
MSDLQPSNDLSATNDETQITPKSNLNAKNESQNTLVVDEFLKNESISETNKNLMKRASALNTSTSTAVLTLDEGISEKETRFSYQKEESNTIKTSNKSNLTSAIEKSNKLKANEVNEKHDKFVTDEKPKLSMIKQVDEVDAKLNSAKIKDLGKERIESNLVEEPNSLVQDNDQVDSNHAASSCSTISKLDLKCIFKNIKNWILNRETGINNGIRPSFVSSAGSEDGSNEINSIPLIELPLIPINYRSREINGFGILSKSQSLPMKIKKQYLHLLTSGVIELIEFCKYLEILNEKFKRHDNYAAIQQSFSNHFRKIHLDLPFTENDLKINEDINEELLLQLKILFNDLFQSNYIIWIVNKFEFDGFVKRFRKLIAHVLKNDFNYDVNYDREYFYKHVVAASLLEWRKNIPFPE